MRLLLIDTSTERGLVALVDGGTLLFCKAFPFGYQQSKHLMPEIVNACEAAGIKPGQLDAIAVGVGPGSYTGIRIGAAVAKTLAYASRIPLVGICTLEAFVPATHEGEFAAVIDAKVGGVYCLPGTIRQGEISYASAPLLHPIEQAGGVLQEISLLVTPNSQSLKDRLEKAHPAGSWTWTEVDPDPLHMAKRARHKMDQGQFSKDGTVELIYLR